MTKMTLEMHAATYVRSGRDRPLPWWGPVCAVVVTALVLAAAAALAARMLPAAGAPPPARHQAVVYPQCPETPLYADSHRLFLLTAEQRLVVFQSPEYLLRATPVLLPGGNRRWLVLTAERLGPQPAGSHLYLLDLRQPGQARRLSPEPSYNFWDLSAGDVDGDGIPEVGLCTYSRTVRDSNYARRFFVYGWTADGDLYPRWRGGRLSRPYLSACRADANRDGQAELVSVEQAPDGGQLLAVYAWNQFGFWGLAESKPYARLRLDPGPGLHATIETAGEQRHVVFVQQDRDLIVSSSPTSDTF